MIPILKTKNELKAFRSKLLGSVGMVPTMGALHEGHLSLMGQSTLENDNTIVSIFVNPLQFSANEDLDSYPQRLLTDTELCESRGVCAIFAPTKDSMYSKNHQTTVVNFDLDQLYCGKYRPDHFKGVLTVVAKLLLLTRPDSAYFGLKDRQQFHLIHKMADDLDFGINIIGCPIIREKSGLAMSSRNEYMSDSQKENSIHLFKTLTTMKEAIEGGNFDTAQIILSAKESLTKSSAFKEIQYLEIVDTKSLLPVEVINQNVIILIAAFMGETRLIDNIEVCVPSNPAS